MYVSRLSFLKNYNISRRYCGSFFMDFTASSRGLKSVCKFKIYKNFAKFLHRRKIIFAHFAKILHIFYKIFCKIFETFSPKKERH